MDRRDGQSIETAQMPEASLLGRYAEDVESGNADMELHSVCDNHSTAIDRATKTTPFRPSPRPTDTGNGAIVAFERVGANRQNAGRRTLTYIGKTTSLRIWRQANGG